MVLEDCIEVFVGRARRLSVLSPTGAALPSVDMLLISQQHFERLHCAGGSDIQTRTLLLNDNPGEYPVYSPKA